MTNIYVCALNDKKHRRQSIGAYYYTLTSTVHLCTLTTLCACSTTSQTESIEGADTLETWVPLLASNKIKMVAKATMVGTLVMAPKSVTFRQHDHLVSVLFGGLTSNCYNITFSIFLYLATVVFDEVKINYYYVFEKQKGVSQSEQNCDFEYEL